MAHDPSLDKYFDNIGLEETPLETLVVTYFDDRAELNKVSVEAKVAEWDDTGEFMELDARAVLDKNEARQLADWIYKWIGV